MNEDTKLVERAAKAGFTLIEIIIAIAIVGIMAAVAVPSINKYISRARITACRQLIQTAHQATVTYSLDHSGKVPDSQDAWVTALTGGDEPEIEGRALRVLLGLPRIEGGADALNDPWGNPLRYEKMGRGNRFKITSDGPDMESGTDDDLTNVAEKK